MKRCGRCGETKAVEAFPFRHRRLGTRHSVCKPCQRDYTRRYHRKDREAYNAARNARMKCYRERNQAYVAAYLATHPCVDCGEADPIVLEFDHVFGLKRREISILVGEGARVAALRDEIAKCVVRCANCHRRKTARTFGYWKHGVEQGIMPAADDYSRSPAW